MRFLTFASAVVCFACAYGQSTFESPVDSSIPPLFGQGSIATIKVSDLRQAQPKANVIAKAQGDIVFSDDFTDGEYCRTNYTYLDLDGDAVQDGANYENRWFWKEDEELMQYCSDKKHLGNDWLITPAIALDKESSYKLTFAINSGAPANLRVTLGTSPDPADHTVVLNDITGFKKSKTTFTAEFTVPEVGNYYIGFYNHNGLDGFYLNLFSIKIERGLDGKLPNTPENFNVVSAENGVEQAVLTFVAPTTKINGDPLAGTAKANIYRDGTKIESITIQAGADVRWEDNNVPSGEHTYKVTVEDSDGESVAVENTVFVGTDLPDMVGNFVALVKDAGMSVHLSWTAPEKGANDGYFDINDVTYAVYRSDDGDTFTLVKDGLTELSYIDNDVAGALEGCPYQQESFYYAVVAVNKTGMSEADTELVVIGTPYEAPVGESFSQGKMSIRPWTINNVKGLEGWQCLNNDPDAGMSSFNQDNGFIKFSNEWYRNVVDVRLISPMIDISSLEDPVFCFYMFHWFTDDVYNEDTTQLTIEVSTDGGKTFEAVSEPIKAAIESEGWREHKISLAKFKGMKDIRISLRGYMACTWMYYYVDHLMIEENLTHDLAAVEISTPKSGSMNESVKIGFRYINRGLESAEGYTVNLIADDMIVDSKQGEAIAPGEMKTVEFEHIPGATYGNRAITYFAEISYNSDEREDNNESVHKEINVEGAWYPTITGLDGQSSDDHLFISWAAPELPTEVTTTEDGAEDYEPLAISGFGNWLTYDGDERGCGKHAYMPEFLNSNVNQAFQIWAPYQIEGLDISEDFTSLKPRTGDQRFISWYANVQHDYGGGNVSDPWNDDWLISEQILPGSRVSFYIKRLGLQPDKDQETYEILYSSTNRDIESFNKIEGREAGLDWELVEFDLPEDARYFAVRYTGLRRWGIMIDDFSYVSAIHGLEVKGYNLYRYGNKINSEPLPTAEFTDYDVIDGQTYEYAVSTVYNLGESVASEPVLITYNNSNSINDVKGGSISVYTQNGSIIVKSTDRCDVSVYSAFGETVYRGAVNNGTLSIPLNKGIYIVKSGNIVRKVIL